MKLLSYNTLDNLQEMDTIDHVLLAIEGNEATITT